jgi:hypothetical protein
MAILINIDGHTHNTVCGKLESVTNRIERKRIMRQWQRGTSSNKSSLWQVYLNTKGTAIIEIMFTLKHV